MKNWVDAPPLQEQHGVVVGDAGELAAVGLGLLHRPSRTAAAVAVLEDADAGAVEVPERGLRLAQHLLGQHGRAGGEVEDAARLRHGAARSQY